MMTPFWKDGPDFQGRLRKDSQAPSGRCVGCASAVLLYVDAFDHSASWLAATRTLTGSGALGVTREFMRKLTPSAPLRVAANQEVISAAFLKARRPFIVLPESITSSPPDFPSIRARDPARFSP